MMANKNYMKFAFLEATNQRKNKKLIAALYSNCFCICHLLYVMWIGNVKLVDCLFLDLPALHSKLEQLEYQVYMYIYILRRILLSNENVFKYVFHIRPFEWDQLFTFELYANCLNIVLDQNVWLHHECVLINWI